MTPCHPTTSIGARRAAALILALCVFAAGSRGAEAPSSMRFRHIGVEEGLPSGSVSALLVDHEGYLWIGLHGGLCRYDGVRLELFIHDAGDTASLPSNMVTALAEDRDGRLWVGTDKGLAVIDTARMAFRRYAATALGASTDDPEWVVALHVDAGGALWVSCGGGLARRAASEERFQLVRRGSAGAPYWAIATGAGERLWLGSALGLDECDGRTGRLLRRVVRPAGGRSMVAALLADRAGRLWIGTIDGLVLHDPAAGTMRRYRRELPGPLTDEVYYVSAIAEADDGRIWAATPAGVVVAEATRGVVDLVRSDPVGLRGLHGDQTTAVTCAPGGVMAVGTRVGLDLVSRSANKFAVERHDPVRPASLRNDRVWTFIPGPDSALWVGTTTGLDRYDPRTRQFGHSTGAGAMRGLLAGEFVNPSVRDADSVLWFGTWRSGIIAVTPGGAIRRIAALADGTPIPPVLALAPRRAGGVWVGTSLYLALARGAELTRIDPGSEAASIATDGVTALLEDGAGRLWIGSAKGFYRRGAAPEELLFVPTDRVTCLAGSSARGGEIVVGTSAGLELRPADAPARCRRRFTQADGLPSAVIQSVLEERPGVLWVGTLRGLVRLETEGGALRIFDAADGMPGLECNQNAALRLPSGEMYFGTNHGFVHFFPDRLAMNAHVPPVAVRSLRVFERGGRRDSLCRPAARFEFDHDWNSFTFESAALDYAMPERNRTAITLEGFDDGWRTLPVGQHGARYTNLDPGSYTLRVRGSNGDGVWNEEGTSVVIVIRPPFWGTWWFRAGGAFALLVALASVVQLRGRSAARRNAALELRVAERTEELHSSNRRLAEHKESLEAQVRERTRDLEATVATLQEEVASRAAVENELRGFQGALRRLASDLSRSEERERRRVAVFLHDVVGQTLFFCKMKLGSLSAAGESADLVRVYGLVEDLLNQVQSLTFELSPPVLYELGLEEAIARHIGQLRRSHAIEIAFTRTDCPGRLSDELRFVLFTAVRELLANALKHASATRIDVEYGPWEGTAVRLVVRDNGAGFDTARLGASGGAEGGGFGLFHVRERLMYLGGSFDVASAIGRGTTVEVLLPVDAGGDITPAQPSTFPEKGPP